jgi:hypothetical protein
MLYCRTVCTNLFEMEDEEKSDEEGVNERKICDHTYLGMSLEDSSGYLNMIQDEERNCGVCAKEIDSAFYRFL